MTSAVFVYSIKRTAPIFGMERIFLLAKKYSAIRTSLVPPSNLIFSDLMRGGEIRSRKAPRMMLFYNMVITPYIFIVKIYFIDKKRRVNPC